MSRPAYHPVDRSELDVSDIARRLERNLPLRTTHRRVQVVHHCRDRHVHDRRVDDEDLADVRAAPVEAEFCATLPWAERVALTSTLSAGPATPTISTTWSPAGDGTARKTLDVTMCGPGPEGR